MNIKKIITISSLFLLAFLLDVGFFMALEKLLISAVLCLYIINAIRNATLLSMSLGVILLGLESCLMYGKITPVLWILIPFTLLALKVRHMFYESTWIYYALLTLFLALQIGITEYLILGLSVTASYTFFRIIANIIVMFFIRSLKSIPRQMDNR